MRMCNKKENKNLQMWESETTRVLIHEGLWEKGWRFRYDNAIRRAGSCSHYRKMITMSRHYVKLNGSNDVEIYGKDNVQLMSGDDIELKAGSHDGDHIMLRSGGTLIMSASTNGLALARNSGSILIDGGTLPSASLGATEPAPALPIGSLYRSGSFLMVKYS